MTNFERITADVDILADTIKKFCDDEDYVYKLIDMERYACSTCDKQQQCEDRDTVFIKCQIKKNILKSWLETEVGEKVVPNMEWYEYMHI